MHIIHVVGARPNFMKLAPVHRALRGTGVRQTVVHTGQHYDVNMSDVFFRDLRMPAPDVNLQVGSGTHAQQTAGIMTAFEPVVLAQKPDVVVVYGDVNSTVAAGLVCAKLLVPLAHVEAGLRSFDRTMPEEINRIVTDRLADWLFTPSEDGDRNLRAEGAAPEKIHFVGNVMIDTLVSLLPVADERYPALAAKFGLRKYGLMTLHRPSNVDHAAKLLGILEALQEVSRELPLLFPIHPRTRQRLGAELERFHGIQFAEPLGYLDFLALQRRATVVITDSGGIQEETSFLRVPCLTLRENTERPVTVTVGSNIVVGSDPTRLQHEVRRVLSGAAKVGAVPALWDGHAAERIAAVLVDKRASAQHA